MNIADIVKSILSEYDENDDHYKLPISVDILLDIVKRRCGLTTLQVQTVPIELPNVLGQIKFFYPVPANIRTDESPTTAIIRIQESLNFCWRRFVICKELCHCLIDMAEGDRVTTEDDLIALFEGLASGGGYFIESSGCIVSERNAELLALELLYPFELRTLHAKDLADGKITPHSLALRYRIPEEFAEIGMHDSHLAKMAEKYAFNRPKLAAVK